MRTLGNVLLGLGLTGGSYALFFFDTSVPGGNGMERVHNLGLMNDRQILVIAAGVACVVGVMLLLFGTKTSGSASADSFAQAQEAKRDSEDNFVDAILKDNTNLMGWMLQNSEVRPNGQMRTGRNFLQYAVRCNSKGAVALLLSKGALPSQVDELGESAEDLARNSEDSQMRSLFPQLGLSMGKPADALDNAVPIAQPTARVEPVGSVVPIAVPVTAPASSDFSIAAQFERLAVLRKDGLIDEDEFRRAKGLILAQQLGAA